MAELYANAFTTTLAEPVQPADVTITVAVVAPAALRGGQFRVAINAELLLVTAGQDTTTWTVTRGVEGTTAAAHWKGHAVTHVLTAAGLANAALGVPLFDAYAGKPDGTPVLADSGQPWLEVGTPLLKVVSGKLSTDAASGAVAGYQMYDMGAAVTRIGCDVTFSAYTTGTGVVALCAFKAEFSGPNVPDSNLHLTVNPTGWALGTWTSNSLSVHVTGNFSPVLVADGSTVHRVEIVRDGTTLTLMLPDRTVRSFTNAAYGATPGELATFEVYMAEASTDTRAGIVSCWADAGVPDRADLSPERLLPLLPSTLAYQTCSITTVTATTEATADNVVSAGAVTFDGRTEVRIEFSCNSAHPDAAGSNNLVLVLREDGTSIGKIAAVVAGTAGWMQLPVTAVRYLTPSAGSHTYSIAAFVNAGTGYILAGAGGVGNDMPAHIRITRA